MPQSDKLVTQLKDFAESASDWEELKTPIAGIFVVKPKPKKGEKPSLMLVIHPTDQEGQTTGRSKIFLRSRDSLHRLKESLSNDQTFSIIDAIESINQSSEQSKKAEERILSL
ncbi:MAG: hypothetical protein ACFFD1_09725 [Candidatus Thorarchaeota archaeon]